MTQITWTILIISIIILYVSFGAWWMNKTFKYEHCLNYFIFKQSLKKSKRNIMFRIEMFMTLLLGIGLLTTFVSQIQIWWKKEK